jgi:hypothetical protein
LPKKKQKHGHQPRKSGVILGDISSRLYGLSLCALNVTPTLLVFFLITEKAGGFICV